MSEVSALPTEPKLPNLLYTIAGANQLWAAELSAEQHTQRRAQHGRAGQWRERQALPTAAEGSHTGVCVLLHYNLDSVLLLHYKMTVHQHVPLFAALFMHVIA
jgi:hypothetical protein